MSWFQRLFETYERCAGHEPDGAELMMPISHTTQRAHIEIVIDGVGCFRRASVVQNKGGIVLPATENSAGRTSGEAPHPLCDKLQYCAADYSNVKGKKDKARMKPLLASSTADSSFKGKKESYFDRYFEQLKEWCDSEFCHPKAMAVLSYISKKSVVGDLIREKILIAEEGILVEYREKKGTKKIKDSEKNSNSVSNLFKQLVAKDEGDEKVKDQGDALVRWSVEISGDSCPDVWKDKTLQSAWSSFYASKQSKRGFCMVSGKQEVDLARQHPARLRHDGDKAKLISSNDTSGFTYLGRFLDADQVLGVGYEITQKAHNALRWLIPRQGYRNGDEVIVSWAVAGKPIPDPFKNSLDLFDLGDVIAAEASHADTAQAFAIRLNKAIAGFRVKLDPTDDVVVMGIDSATPGRMAITFYREIKGSEFLERIESWHTKCAWAQSYSKDKKFVGAPSPRDIAEAAYGHMLKGDSGKKLVKATIERILPCIVDGRAIPRDLVEATVSRSVNRLGFKRDIQKRDEYEWEKCLGIACAIFKNYRNPKEVYQMTLEADRTSRDYLYGRLLAVAEDIEEKALYLAKEKRDTNAARLMQRFSDRPYSTWLTIEKALTPYKTRLQSKWPSKSKELRDLLSEIVSKFSPVDDFLNDKRLTGEFLLGYHCQRENLRLKVGKESNVDETTTIRESQE